MIFLVPQKANSAFAVTYVSMSGAQACTDVGADVYVHAKVHLLLDVTSAIARVCSFLTILIDKF